MADPDARRRAEEALRRVLANAAAIVRLSWSDGATPSDRANLERIKSAAADIAQDHKILRALLAAGPEAPPPPSDAVREAAERLWHSLTPPRSTTDDGMLLVRAEDVEAVLRALASSHAAPATVTAPTSPTSDAKWLRVWPYRDGPDHSCAIEFLVSGTQYDAIEVPPPPSDAVREAAEAKATALLGSARHYFAQGHPMREAIDEHLAALRGGQKGEVG